MNSLQGTVPRWADKEEVGQLEAEITEAKWALFRHEQQHGCGDEGELAS